MERIKQFLQDDEYILWKKYQVKNYFLKEYLKCTNLF